MQRYNFKDIDGNPYAIASFITNFDSDKPRYLHKDSRKELVDDKGRPLIFVKKSFSGFPTIGSSIDETRAKFSRQIKDNAAKRDKQEQTPEHRAKVLQREMFSKE